MNNEQLKEYEQSLEYQDWQDNELEDSFSVWKMKQEATGSVLVLIITLIVLLII